VDIRRRLTERSAPPMLSPEVTKRIQGVEQRIAFPARSSARCPSRPGRAFPGGFRAVEPSRVMRLDARQYSAVAAAAAEIAVAVGAAPANGWKGCRGSPPSRPRSRSR